MKRTSCFAGWRGALLAAGFVGARAVLAVEEKIPDLREPHGEMPPTFWELHGWVVVFAAAAGLVVICLGAWWLRQPAPVVVEPPEVIARRELEALRGRVGDGGLAVEVSRILRRYIWAVFEFPPGELTTTEIQRVLQTHPRLNPLVAAEIGGFLRRCDEWKFAPTPPAPQTATLAEALALMEKIETIRRPVPASAA